MLSVYSLSAIYPNRNQQKKSVDKSKFDDNWLLGRNHVQKHNLYVIYKYLFDLICFSVNLFFENTVELAKYRQIIIRI